MPILLVKQKHLLFQGWKCGNREWIQGRTGFQGRKNTPLAKQDEAEGLKRRGRIPV
jgi:hypothetical protein